MSGVYMQHVIFLVSMKLGLAKWGQNMGGGHSRTGCWGGYLGL